MRRFYLERKDKIRYLYYGSLIEFSYMASSNTAGARPMANVSFIILSYQFSLYFIIFSLD